MAILEGQPAPGFSLPDKDGNQISLVGLKGKMLSSISIPKMILRGAPNRHRAFGI